MEQGTHYRTGGKLTHCGCECLPGGKDIPYIVIEKIVFKSTAEIGGRKEDNVWEAYFAPNPYTKLPMVLNATNRKRIAKLYPDCNGYIDLLKNIPVRLTREECRDAQDGGMTWGLRISKMKPTAPPTQQGSPQTQTEPAPTNNQSKQVLDISNANMREQVVKYLKGGGTMERIKQDYTVSAEVEAELLKALKEE